MAEFIFSIFFAIAALGAIVGIIFSHRVSRNPRVWTIVGGVLVLLLSGGLFFQSLFQSVPTKSVGVITSYGKVVGTPYGPGAHLVAPWRTLNPVSDTIQSDRFFQSNGPGSDQPQSSGITGYCIAVRLAGLNQGCADVQMQTQVVEGAIPELYANYSSYGPNLTLDVDQYVVQRELKTILNRTLGDYNVIADVVASLQACTSKGQSSCSSVTTSQFSQFDPIILKALQTDPQLAGKVTVFDVNLQYIHFSGNVENAIESIQTKYTEIEQATLQEQVNSAISTANAALVNTKQGQTLTPAVLTYDCLQEVAAAIKANYPLPTGFSCGGTSSNLILGK